MAIVLRNVETSDLQEIADVVRVAFGGDSEVTLVNRLRDDSLIMVELVAVEGETVVGHVVYSRLMAEIDGRRLNAAALAPVAVRPDRQDQGIGSALIERGLTILQEAGTDIVFVLGHPSYYPRFGFEAELAVRFAAPFPGPAFMALAFDPDIASGGEGSVTYPSAFDA